MGYLSSTFYLTRREDGVRKTEVHSFRPNHKKKETYEFGLSVFLYVIDTTVTTTHPQVPCVSLRLLTNKVTDIFYGCMGTI